MVIENEQIHNNISVSFHRAEMLSESRQRKLKGKNIVLI